MNVFIHVTSRYTPEWLSHIFYITHYKKVKQITLRKQRTSQPSENSSIVLTRGFIKIMEPLKSSENRLS